MNTDLELDLIFQPMGDPWEDRALKPGLQATMDPGDSKGERNELMDILHKIAISACLSLRGDEIVLDFGCGTGRITFWIIDQVKKVVGLDITQEMLFFANTRLKCLECENIDFVHYDGINFPFADESFDLITSIWVLQHVARKEDFSNLVAEISRTLKVGGKLCMIEQISNDPRANVGDVNRSVKDYIMVSEKNKLKCIQEKPIRYSFSIFSWAVYWRLSPLSHLFSRGLIPHAILPLIAKLELIYDERRSPISPKRGYVEHLFLFVKS